MTVVTFYRRGDTLLGFKSKGHSGYADEGSDIVCAAVSAVTQTAAIMAEEILKIENAVTVSEANAELTVKTDGDKSFSDHLFSMLIFLSELEKQYPKHIKTQITEVQTDDQN